MKELLIFPFNGNGLEAVDAIGTDYKLIGFVDDTPEKQGINANGYPVYDRSAFKKFPDAKVLAVPGSALTFKERKAIIVSLPINTDRFITIIHPDARVSKTAQIGINCLIYAGVVVTSNARLGDHICILPNSVVHHDTVIDDYTIVGSNVCIAGRTTIGDNCYIGSGSNIMNNIRLGNNVLVGLGSNVIKNVDSNTIVFGNPARVI